MSADNADDSLSTYKSSLYPSLQELGSLYPSSRDIDNIPVYFSDERRDNFGAYAEHDHYLEVNHIGKIDTSSFHFNHGSLVYSLENIKAGENLPQSASEECTENNGLNTNNWDELCSLSRNSKIRSYSREEHYRCDFVSQEKNLHDLLHKFSHIKNECSVEREENKCIGSNMNVESNSFYFNDQSLVYTTEENNHHEVSPLSIITEESLVSQIQCPNAHVLYCERENIETHVDKKCFNSINFDSIEKNDPYSTQFDVDDTNQIYYRIKHHDCDNFSQPFKEDSIVSEMNCVFDADDNNIISMSNAQDSLDEKSLNFGTPINPHFTHLKKMISNNVNDNPMIKTNTSLPALQKVSNGQDCAEYHESQQPHIDEALKEISPNIVYGLDDISGDDATRRNCISFIHEQIMREQELVLHQVHSNASFNKYITS